MSALKPVLPSLFDDCEQLNIPALEWAGRVALNRSKYYGYEFIGKYDALIAAELGQHHMFAVGISGKKQGSGYRVQKLANDRFRLEVYSESLGIDAVLAQVNAISPSTIPAPAVVQYDPISASLKKTSMLVRKYPHEFQSELYQCLCEAKGNGWQLIESFPWLAVRVFVFHDRLAHEARHFVWQGAKTREIAELVNVPMCFKRFAAAHQARLLKVHDFLSEHTDLVSHHCPKRVPDQGSWLSHIRTARSSGSSDFAIWVAVHWSELSAIESNRRLLRSKICDLQDWVRVCVVQRIGSENIDSICQLLNNDDAVSAIENWWGRYSYLAEAGKPFNKEMSVQTVIKLSWEWHERQAVTRAADVEFPQEWYEGGTVGNFRIEPIRTAAELSKYAYYLHNCATSYAHDIAKGHCFMYVVFEGGDLKAMLQIKRRGGSASVDQLKGPRNGEVSAELKIAVDTWWKKRKTPAKSQSVEVAEAI